MITQPLLRVSNLDFNFKDEIMSTHQVAHDLKACFTCGTCSAGCPIHLVYPEYDPMKMVRMIILGLKKELLASQYIWYCATCHNCEQRCPQGVKFFDILNIVKNMAAQAGFAPPAWLIQARQLNETGIVFPTEEAWVKKREEFGLRPLKPKGEEISRLM